MAKDDRMKSESPGTKRHLVQLFAALLYNLDFRGIATASVGRASSKGICAPGLHCYSCPGAIAACPIGALQQSLSSASLPMTFYVAGTLLAFGAIAGRTICGWACPFGLIQDIMDKAGRALRLPAMRKGAWSRRLSWLKYAMLGLAIAGPVATLVSQGLGKPLFCTLICPAGTLPGISLVASNPMLQSMVGALFSWKVSVLLAIVAAMLFVYRPFCRFLCPLGALYGFFNRFCILRYTVDPEACTKCGACISACRMDAIRVGDRECIQCGACKAACEFGAIRFSIQMPKKPARPLSRQTTAPSVGTSSEMAAPKSSQQTTTPPGSDVTPSS